MNTLSALNASSDSVESPEAKRSAKIHDAAQSFEALMISQMMKTARQTNSDGWLSDGGETGEDSTMDMAESQFAQAMASHGGLGLAKMIESTMQPKPASAPPETGTAAPADLSSATTLRKL